MLKTTYSSFHSLKKLFAWSVYIRYCVRHWEYYLPCTCVHTHTHICIFMHRNTHRSTCTQTYIHISLLPTYSNKCIQIYVSINTHAVAYRQIYIFNTCTFIYLHTYTCKNTYVHVYKHIHMSTKPQFGLSLIYGINKGWTRYP